MRVCVVGNGPSAIEHAADIDACDFVVRMCGWWRSRPGDSGKRLDAYAWFGTQWQMEIPDPWRTVSFQHWFTLPPSRCNPPNSGHCGFWQNVVDMACLRPTFWIPERQWRREAAYLAVESKQDWIETPPSTGFTAIDMALHLFAPDELVLYGFDATVASARGWGDNNPHWSDNGPHDLLAEKRLLHRLAMAGEWLGKQRQTKVVWPDNPIG